LLGLWPNSGEPTERHLVASAVLRILRHTDLVAAELRLAAYQARCEARPAFQRTLRDQMAAFEQR
jgi:glutathione S-transferase